MSCPIDKIKGRWERRKESRPQELLAAALDLFVERGYAATRLDDVAARAGVSKGTLYLYFANKEELFKEMVRQSILPAIGEAEATVSSYEGSTRELFKTVLFSWWEKVGSTKLSGIAKLMMAESGNFPEVANFYNDEVIMRGNALIANTLQRGIKTGEFRAINLEMATHVICAPILMLMMWKHSTDACHIEEKDHQAYLSTFVDLLLDGLHK